MAVEFVTGHFVIVTVTEKKTIKKQHCIVDLIHGTIIRMNGVLCEKIVDVIKGARTSPKEQVEKRKYTSVEGYRPNLVLEMLEMRCFRYVFFVVDVFFVVGTSIVAGNHGAVECG